MVMDNTSDGDNQALDGDKLMMDGQADTGAYPANAMTPHDFIGKWRGSELKESSGSQEHFIDLCRLLGEPTPAEADPTGQTYCFERDARKDSGRAGWADVWKRGHFAWEYKGKHANLDRAFNQLRQYALALENPPLLIVSDMVRFRIRTNWTNSVSETHEFELEDLARAEVREKLKWAMSDPERLRPGITRQTLTEQTATTFANLAQTLRQRGHKPRVVAQFVNRLVFCMFAEDVDLLPDSMFTRMLERAVQTPDNFVRYAQQLFRAMADGSEVGFESVAWFNGGLFDDDTALPLEKAEITTVLETASLDWADIDPAILGTLFERGLDPDKRSQLGAHYTDRDMIMRIIKPVVSDPWLAEWEETKKDIERHLARARRGQDGINPQPTPRTGGQHPQHLPGTAQEVHSLGSGVRIGQLPLSGTPCPQGSGTPRSAGGGGIGSCTRAPVCGTSERQGHRDQSLRSGTRSGFRLGRRDPVDAPQRFPGLPRSHPEASRHH